jgi:hypothetical protein
MRLFNFINPDSAQTAIGNAMQKLHLPSWVSSRDSTIAKGKSPIHSWRDELSTEQIRKGQNTLHSFGLDRLYGHDDLPDKNALANLVNLSQLSQQVRTHQQEKTLPGHRR